MGKRRTTKTGEGNGEIAKATQAQPEEPTPYFPLSKLLLDGGNPRLGAQAGKLKSQVEILDAVVNVFGIDDVLSSLAVNGYFEAEPMVGVRQPDTDHIRIAEGNRRLAACLILANDERARHHQKRIADYQRLQKKHNQPPITSVPVRVLDDSRNLLSYLGVRHIAASQPWDSYAKAAWVAKVLKANDLTLADVTEMIGDQHNTVARALEGYYFVNQLTSAAAFAPSDSMRPGRGSNPEYPFSWVYTALGYGPIREWLDLKDLADEGPVEKPLKNKSSVDEASDMMTLLFGNKSKGRNPAIADSRQIADLARAVADPNSRRLLKRGKSVEEVSQLLRPPKERVSDGLYDAREALQAAMVPLSEGEIDEDEATELQEPSKRVRNLATEVYKRIIGIMAGNGGTDATEAKGE